MEQNQICRPDKVRQGVMLLYVALGIATLHGIMEAPEQASEHHASVGLALFVTFLSLGTGGFCIYMIGKGKNWARITLLVLVILGTPLVVTQALQSLAANRIPSLLDIATLVIEIIALIFLFQKPSSEWFRHMKATRTYQTTK